MNRCVTLQKPLFGERLDWDNAGTELLRKYIKTERDTIAEKRLCLFLSLW